MAPRRGVFLPALAFLDRHLDAIPAMHPALVAIERGAHTAPFAIGLEDLGGLAEDHLIHLLETEAGTSEDRRDGGAGNERGGHEGAASLAAHAAQSVTPRKVQMRQMKVPH